MTIISAINLNPYNLYDGLKLTDCQITNAVKCAAPKSYFYAEEIDACNRFLVEELKVVHKKAVILCLGEVTNTAVKRAFERQLRFKFEHGTTRKLADGRLLFNSYHCANLT